MVIDGDESKQVGPGEMQQYYASRCLLAAQSEFFTKLFARGDLEPRDKNGRYVYVMEGIEVDEFETVLRFLYSAMVVRELKKPIDLTKLLHAANKYRLEDLQNQCENLLAEQLQPATCLSTLRTSDQVTAATLKRKTLDYIRTNKLDIRELPGWADLSRELVGELWASAVCIPNLKKQRI